MVLAKPETTDPEGDERLNFLDEQDRSDAFDFHGIDLLRGIGLQGNETERENKGDIAKGEVAHGADSP